MRSTPAPPTGRGELSPDADRSAGTYGLLALFLSLVGFAGIALLLYEFKFHDVTATCLGLPTRVLFVLSALLAAAPFLVTAFRRVPVLLLVPAVILIFLLYPLFTPNGLPYSRDPVFVYQLSNVFLATGSWHAGSTVTLQAITYSYYPGAGIFNAEASTLTALPLLTSFVFSAELFRLLVVPLLIYALASRVFSSRTAPLAVLLYATVPSIEMNIPTQQDFAVVFFLVAVVCIAYLVRATPEEVFPLRITLLMATAMVIISHHVSTYLLLSFLGAIALIPRVLWQGDPYPRVRSMWAFLTAVAIALFWVGLVSLPVIEAQSGILAANLHALFHPGPSVEAIPGATFPVYQLGWIALAMTVTVGISLLTLLEARRRQDESFVTVSILAVLLLGILSIPFLSTGFSFLALRQFEYTGVFLAPVASWWIITRLASPYAKPLRSLLPSLRPAPRLSNGPVHPNGLPHHARRRVVATVIVLSLVVTGGLLVPLSTRDQFATQSQLLDDSPMFITQNAYLASQFANQYLAHNHAIWGDMLSYTTFGGFGDFKLVWDSYPLFNGTGFNATVLQRLHLGSYVVTDVLMTRISAPPVFPGPNNEQPSTPLLPAEVAKFDNTAYFAPVYSNPVFTIYIITAIPPAGG